MKTQMINKLHLYISGELSGNENADMEKQIINIFYLYISGELSGNEKDDFEKVINENIELKKEFMIFKAVREIRRKELKAKLEKHELKQPNTISRVFYIKLAAAAAVLFVFLFPIYNYFTYNKQLFAEYNIQDRESKKNNMALNNKFAKDKYSHALDFFEKNNYQQAEELFSGIEYSEHNYQQYFKAQYYIALCYVVQKKDNEAKMVLTNLIKHKHFSGKNSNDCYWIRGEASKFSNDISNPRFTFSYPKEK